MESMEKVQSEEILGEVNDGKRDMVVGGLWCLGGLIVTIGTYAFASGGGTYFVAWGAVIFGAIQFFKGLIQAEKFKNSEASSNAVKDQKPGHNSVEQYRTSTFPKNLPEEAKVPKWAATLFWAVFGVALVALITWGRSRI